MSFPVTDGPMELDLTGARFGRGRRSVAPARKAGCVDFPQE